MCASAPDEMESKIGGKEERDDPFLFSYSFFLFLYKIVWGLVGHESPRELCDEAEGGGGRGRERDPCIAT